MNRLMTLLTAAGAAAQAQRSGDAEAVRLARRVRALAAERPRPFDPALAHTDRILAANACDAFAQEFRRRAALTD